MMFFCAQYFVHQVKPFQKKLMLSALNMKLFCLYTTMPIEIRYSVFGTFNFRHYSVQAKNLAIQRPFV